MKFKKLLLGCATVAAMTSLASCTEIVSTSNPSHESISTPDTGIVSSLSNDESTSESANVEVSSSEEKNTSTLTNEEISSSEETTTLETSSSANENPNTNQNSKTDDKKTNPDIVITNEEFSMLKVDTQFETIYGEFLPVAKYSSYNVYYKANTDKEFKVMDKQLLRLYKYNDSYKYRFDIVGLKKGVYDIKICGVADKEDTLQEVKSLTVLSYDRSGFAFSSNSRIKSGSGAYNDDGTLKSNAKVIYVDKSNAKTVKATIGGKEAIGLQDIIYNNRKGTDIIDIRVIGELQKSDLDRIDSSAEGLQIKGSSSYQEMNITFEGIGEDASINGFGMLIRNSSNIEVRNIGILNFMDDGISLDTDNSNVWIHNCDFYYGSVGGDADQAKGDGSSDIKGDSQFITVSYNHYYDSGKSSLCGMKSESGPNYIDYHHNWFDHSDSRHPRIRTMSVHVYNNYYDGNSKYGVGATCGSSAFVENNYFRNCHYPVLASKQGTDAEGEGTFSGENGGFIKCFNNTIIGAKKVIYQNQDNEYSKASATSFDAYLASTRDEVISDSIKTLVGNTSYDNFDTKIDMGVKLLESPEDCVETVKKYSGRLNGGDFKWTFNNSVDDDSYAVNKELKEAVTKYHNTQIVSSIGANSSSNNNENKQEDNKDENKGVIESGLVVSFAKNGKVISSSSPLVSVSAKVAENKGSVSYNGVEYKIGAKMESSSTISFHLEKDMKVKIAISAKASGKPINLDGEKLDITVGTDVQFVELDLIAGDHTISKGDKENYIFLIIFE